MKYQLILAFLILTTPCFASVTGNAIIKVIPAPQKSELAVVQDINIAQDNPTAKTNTTEISQPLVMITGDSTLDEKTSPTIFIAIAIAILFVVFIIWKFKRH